MSQAVAVALAKVLALGIGAHWIAWRLRLPSIIVMLAAGFVAGPVLGFLDPDAAFGELLLPVVSIAVAIILFEGGLSLRFRDIRDVGGVVARLVSVGAVVTWAVAAAAASVFLGVGADTAVLIGAVLVVTGPTVVQPLLRLVRPTGRAGPVLRWEGIVIDPIGAILAVLVFEVITLEGGATAPAVVLEGVAWTVLFGGGFGLLGAAVIVVLFARHRVPDHLENPVALSVLIAAVAAADLTQSESGLMAATVMGIALANQQVVGIRHLVEFKENLRVVLLSALFIVLAARLDLEALRPLGIGVAGFVLVLLLVARPLSVAASTVGSALSWRERAFVAAMAPRGIVAAAVASIFGARLTQQGHADAALLVPVTFVVIASTVLVYGLSAVPLARALKAGTPDPQGVLVIGANTAARTVAAAAAGAGVTVRLVDTNPENVRQARSEGLDAHAANALADDIEERVELAGIGRLVAITPNDEVNALAAIRFGVVFGRANVYQLPAEYDGSGTGAVPREFTGRRLFGADADLSSIMARVATGATVERLTIADEEEARRVAERTDLLPLFVLSGDDRLAPVPATPKYRPEPGTTLLALGPAPQRP